MVFKASGAASFPESLRIHTLEVSLSLMVTSAPLWLLPITVSISKSPNRSFKSTIAGRSSISARLGMYPLPAREFPRLLRSKIHSYNSSFYLIDRSEFKYNDVSFELLNDTVMLFVLDDGRPYWPDTALLIRDERKNHTFSFEEDRRLYKGEVE